MTAAPFIHAAPGPADVALRGVTKAFGSDVVLHPLDLEIRRGEFFSLLGPSGCGKTTTLRIIAGLEKPTAGDVLIRGISMEGVPVEKRPTNLVFQKLALFPHLSVFDNVAFGLRMKHLPRAEIRRRVEEMLARVRLEGFERRAISQLSGGQQQRVAIARALVNEPAVLLLDEPLGALDLQLQLHMQQELVRIQRASGTTFIYVTHNQQEALAMSDRIAVMNGGRVEQVDMPVALFRRPASEFVARFMGQTNVLSGRVREANGAGVRIEAAGLTFHVGSAPGLVLGQPVKISVRPERLRIVPPRSGRIVLPVERAVFQGVTTLYVLRLPGGSEISVSMLASPQPLPGPGELVGLVWDDDAAIPLGIPAQARETERAREPA
jgi:spermidine/putrescine transport system ATP-binding protein